MSEKQKKIIFAILFVLFVLLLGWLLFVVFFKTQDEIIQTPTETFQEQPLSTLPETDIAQRDNIISESIEEQPLPNFAKILGITPTETAQGTLTRTQTISDTPVSGLLQQPSGSGIAYYDKTDGKFYKVDASGEIKTLSNKTFYNVENTTWSPNANSTILEYPDGSNIFYDFISDKQITLPKNWEDFSFNATGSQIAFKDMNENPDLQWLSIANPDGSGKHSVAHMGINADQVTVSYSPSEQIVAYYEEPSGENVSTVYFVGKNNENFKAARISGYGLQSKWTPSGDKLVYSTYTPDSDYIPELWLINAQGDQIGENRIKIGLRTWADKCSFGDSSTLYCAVPQSIQYGAGLEPAVNNDIPDDIYKVNIKTGAIAKVAETDIQAPISSISVNERDKALYFTETNENTLHKIKL